MKKLKEWFVLRWRLWSVCRRLKIRPYRWQREYALGKSYKLMTEKGCGKSTAVMLYGLIHKVITPNAIAYMVLWDPYARRDNRAARWSVAEYLTLVWQVWKCDIPKVNVVYTEVVKLKEYFDWLVGKGRHVIWRN